MFSFARKIFPPIKQSFRLLSQDVPQTKLQEIVKIIDPESTVKVSSSVKLIIRPYDLLDCPDANTLRASISTSCQKSQADLSVEVNGTTVEITETNIKGHTEKLECLLEVPVKADLDVTADRNVHVSNMHGSFFRLLCKENIFTKNIHSTTIALTSKGGDIKSSGILLGNKIEVVTFDQGSISLDKLQGDVFHCKTENGNISTNSCYVDSSNFVTEKGTLNLKNVHKKSEIYVLKEGDINMTGIHGNIYIKSNGGNLKLQFSEIFGDNFIMAGNSKQVSINISDLIEENCFIEIHSDKLTLDDSLMHLTKYMENDNYLSMGKEFDSNNKLLICTKGLLRFGKMSWIDSVKMSVSNKEL